MFGKIIKDFASELSDNDYVTLKLFNTQTNTYRTVKFLLANNKTIYISFQDFEKKLSNEEIEILNELLK